MASRLPSAISIDTIPSRLSTTRPSAAAIIVMHTLRSLRRQRLPQPALFQMHAARHIARRAHLPSLALVAACKLIDQRAGVMLGRIRQAGDRRWQAKATTSHPRARHGLGWRLRRSGKVVVGDDEHDDAVVPGRSVEQCRNALEKAAPRTRRVRAPARGRSER
ncbi:hypothetical protein RZS08_42925, partial [Arthrospira platensis SPKY1]|nr:hypothetical protein [Arthrospira platensis SPKY1]